MTTALVNHYEPHKFMPLAETSTLSARFNLLPAAILPSSKPPSLSTSHPGPPAQVASIDVHGHSGSSARSNPSQNAPPSNRASSRDSLESSDPSRAAGAGVSAGGVQRSESHAEDLLRKANSRISSLEKTIEFLQKDHSTVLSALHQEIERLSNACHDAYSLILLKQGKLWEDERVVDVVSKDSRPASPQPSKIEKVDSEVTMVMTPSGHEPDEYEGQKPLYLLLDKQKKKYQSVIERMSNESKRKQAEMERLMHELELMRHVLTIAGIKVDLPQLKTMVESNRHPGSKGAEPKSVGPSANVGSGCGVVRGKVLPPIERDDRRSVMAASMVEGQGDLGKSRNRIPAASHVGPAEPKRAAPGASHFRARAPRSKLKASCLTSGTRAVDERLLSDDFNGWEEDVSTQRSCSGPSPALGSGGKASGLEFTTRHNRSMSWNHSVSSGCETLAGPEALESMSGPLLHDGLPEDILAGAESHSRHQVSLPSLVEPAPESEAVLPTGRCHRSLEGMASNWELGSSIPAPDPVLGTAGSKLMPVPPQTRMAGKSGSTTWVRRQISSRQLREQQRKEVQG
ncbi:uncharacterized protein BJ171DRAFT_606120 [Polychytrium aggregatum]|uniref:uncharacterized protein n=1 Tax=Polychytrium aggregatum TaxID=110093 RepID=UPI0022FEF44E|nr:uncharacterized protein BJ171DRAFT_606120 [Polychytrium aggregatum]KAI9190804.1 hypothetical protein BJ171DRAFT_606120 [Polychytrium aggregatum]